MIKALQVICYFLLLTSCESSKDDPIAKQTVQVQIGKNALLCSALMLSEGIILTAAHCIGDKDTESIQMNSKSKRVEKIVVHKFWNPALVDFDIAVVVLKDYNLNSVTKILDHSINPKDKLKSYVFEDTKKYTKSHTAFELVGEKIIAYDDSKSDAICRGNSGAPVYYFEGSTAYLAGIVSGVIGMRGRCNDGKKSVFVSVRYFAPWFNGILAELDDQD